MWVAYLSLLGLLLCCESLLFVITVVVVPIDFAGVSLVNVVGG